VTKRLQKVPKNVAGVSHMAAGPGPTVVSGGKTWRLGFNTQDAKGRLEELVRGHVVRDAIKTKRAVGGADGDETYAHTDRLLKQGHYYTFAQGWAEIIQSPVGAVMFLMSLLQEHHPDATEADAMRLLADEPEQIEAAVSAVSPDFFAAAAVQRGVRPEDAVKVSRAVAASIETRAAPGSDSTS